MLIVCPSCATSYDIASASLQPHGRQVRCVRCRTVWQVTPAGAESILADAGAAAAPVHDAPAPAMDLAGGVAPATFGAPDRGRTAAAATRPELSDRPADLEPDAAPDREAATDAAEQGAAAGGSPGDSGSGPDEAVIVEAPPIAPAAPGADLTSTEIEADDRDVDGPGIDLGGAERDAAAAAPRRRDIETLAARRARRAVNRRRGWPMSGLHTAVVALLVIDAMLVGWRKEVVRVLPQTASFYALLGLGVNLRGLDFENVSTAMEQHDGVPILVVQGSIVNDDAGAVVALPRLKFAIRNAARQEIYAWIAAPSRTTLAPGQGLGFRSRLASPPPDGRDVLVRFMTPRDVISDAR